MIISSRPYPCLKVLPPKKGFDLSDLIFFDLGRSALLFGFIRLGLIKGDSIILPAYMCSSAIQPLIDYGFKLIYLDIDQSLGLSESGVLKTILKHKSIKALLVVHYFGITKNIDTIISICRQYEIKVVEDASHSFMSQMLRNKISINSDAEIFSMRKSLPVIDGGALRINKVESHSFEISTYKSVSITKDVKNLALRLLEIIVVGLGVNIYSQFINTIKKKIRNTKKSEEVPCDPHPSTPSWQLKRYIESESYLQESKNKITHNFDKLSSVALSLGFKVLVSSVDRSIVPQAFVIIDDKGGLSNYLKSKGIGAWRWPAEELPLVVAENPIDYPNSNQFNKNLVLIPIHQSINYVKIKKIIKILGFWKAEKF